MKRLLILIPVLAAAVLFAGAVGAQSSASAELRLVSEAEVLTVGDPLTFTVAVEHPVGTQAVFPQLEANWGDFEVIGQSAPESAENDTTVTTIRNIEATAFTPGELVPPPITVAIYDSSGNVTNVSAEAAPVTIASVLIEGDTELRDIKPQATVPLVPLWAWAIGGVILVVGTAIWLFRRRRSKRTVAQLPPYEEALAALNAIVAQDLPGSAAYKLYYTSVTDTVRRYIERRFGLPMLERTTDEVRHTLIGSEIQPSLQISLINMLADADLVKFAKVTPDNAGAQQLMINARLFIEATRPIVTDSAEKSGTTPRNPNQPVEVPA
ncbi:MAG: hypothetical protein M9928_04905 [Anaerolineae bacterium]|nr:hypothetical protein [Anaerolineae bacterium]